MAQINIILFIATNIRSFIIAKATRNSAKGISGISIWTPFFLTTCHRLNEFFFYKVVFVGLSAFNILKQVANVWTPQRKTAMPPRGSVPKGVRQRGLRIRETRWREKITNIISNPLDSRSFSTGASGMRKRSMQRVPHLMESPSPSPWCKEEVTEFPPAPLLLCPTGRRPSQGSPTDDQKPGYFPPSMKFPHPVEFPTFSASW